MRMTRCAICREPMPEKKRRRVYARCGACDIVARQIAESHTIGDPQTLDQLTEERLRRMTCRVAPH